MKRLIIFIVLLIIGLVALSFPLLAQTPTISSIILSSPPDHASVTVQYKVNAGGGTCQLTWGLSSGSYIYQGGSEVVVTDLAGVHWCTVTIGGLQPSLTYYINPTARPGANVVANICQVGAGCGSVEQVFTTSAIPAIHPAPPTPPSSWTPVEPDVSGYTLVSMKPATTSGTDTQGRAYAVSDCVAVSGVANPGGSFPWSSGVTANDTYQTVINEINLDTLIEHAEGISCNIPPLGGFKAGVQLPRYTPGGTNDWVMIRTHANAASDFPPFGMRTGPQYAARLASLIAVTPAEGNAPPHGINTAGQNFNGQIFNCPATGCNHFWIENITFDHAVNSTIYPAGSVDPLTFTYYVGATGTCVYIPNTGCDITVAATTPDHIVLDRVYIPVHAWPSREEGCFNLGGTFWAIINSWCSVNQWIQAVWPGQNPAIASNVITVPFSFFQQNQFDNNPIGMQTAAAYAGTYSGSLTLGSGSYTVGPITIQSGLSWVPGDIIELINTMVGGQIQQYNTEFTMMGPVTAYNPATGSLTFTAITTAGGAGNAFSGWRVVQPVTVTFSGAGAYTGTVFAWLGSGGLTIDFQTSTGVSAVCVPATFCTVTSEATPAYTSIPITSMYYFDGAFNGSGSFVLGCCTVPNFGIPTQFATDRPLGFYLWANQFGIFDNNFIQAIGQTVYNDTLGPTFADTVWTHNTFSFPRTKMQNSPVWDGYGYIYRNVVETKQMQRARYCGNIFDGSGGQRNPGNVIYIAGSFAGSYSSGTQDITICSNIGRHISSGIQMAGGGAQSGNDSPAINRVAITNNLFLDINRNFYSTYNQGIAGFISGPFSTYPMSEDVNISNNTVGLTGGSGPSLLFFGGASDIATTVMGEGLAVRNNIFLTSLNGLDVFDTLGGYAYSNFPPNPVVPLGQSVPVSPGTWQGYLDGSFIHTGASITPSWSMGNNMIVGGQNGRGAPASSSSIVFGTGSQTFVVSSGSFVAGQGITVYPNNTTGCAEYGTVTSFSGTVLVALISSTTGPCLGTYSAWSIAWADLTGSQITSLISGLWPASDTTSVFPTGANMPARLAAIGWNAALDLANGNPGNYPAVPTVYNAGNTGANVTVVNQAAGITTDITLAMSSTVVMVAYVAPDSKACSWDLSPAGANTWTRQTDSGGSFLRSVSFTGLAALTNYDYRGGCYFEQSAASEFIPSQITSGTVTTARSATTTMNTTFTLPSGATKVLVSFQGLAGSPASATCTTSPCVIAGVPVGTDARTMTFQTSGSATVGAPSTVSVVVQ